uniref:Uncharacterized protein n=1 Tax=Glossina morsitans morsitans TaxID=37546 RepID=A0A1B0GFD9_GLOMM
MKIEWWSKLDSTVAYGRFWSCFRILGVADFRYKALSQFYVICLTLFVTVYCPIHLLIGLLMLTDAGDFFKNFSMTLTSLVCSLKYFFLRLNLNKIHQLIKIYSELDKRVSTADECDYLIGYNKRKSQKYHEDELKLCIEDHQKLLKYLKYSYI